MRGNSHVRFLGEGQPVMAVPYPTFAACLVALTPYSGIESAHLRA
ncbi:hypothetical protein [Vibrio rotiferianus]|nr:hypothetical protein [Vibrio rotiferianus]